jgi:hypothetical protein
MAKELETNDSDLFSKSDEREDSGLRDILSVAASIKDSEDEELSDGADDGGEDSGMIMFTAGDLGGGDKADDEEAVFGSFAGGLASGFVAPAEPVTSPDLTPLGGSGGVSEAKPAEARAKPAEEPKRSPLTAVAVVLGLGLAAVGFVFLNNKDDNAQKQQPQQAEMSANVDDAAVGKAEPLPEDPNAAGASAGTPVQPEPEPLPPEAETEGVLGEDAGALLAADTSDGADPMAQKAGLLDGGKNPVNKNGKWDQGTSIEKPDEGGEVVEPEPDPDPLPLVDPKPKSDGEAVKGTGGPANDDEVDCLLNPDLPKCSGGGGGTTTKEEQILAPKLPESLSERALRDGFNTVKSKAKACGSKFGAAEGTKVKVHVSIEGATGKVSTVEATGEHAGTDLGKCVEDAVKNATFSQFKKPSQGADYSLTVN